MLERLFELVWATTWGEEANTTFGPILGLPRLPVLPLADLPRSGTRKLAAVDRYVMDREVAWLDDELYDDAQAWATSRPAATLLLRTRGSVGWSVGEFDRLREFGESRT